MKKNVYQRARDVVRELVPVLQTVRDCDKSLADQLRRAAQRVVLNIAQRRGSAALRSPGAAWCPRRPSSSSIWGP